MTKKQKKPPSKPSKAYLVSFGDTMTALLAFFIVLNSLAKEQTGANLYTGTGSFVQAIKSIGVPGQYSGDRSDQVVEKKAPAPIYAVPSEEQKHMGQGSGPDDEDDRKRVVDRQTENFKRFLSEMNYRFDVNEEDPIKNQTVFDSFENLNKSDQPLGSAAIELAADAISQLANDEKFELDIVVWAKVPSPYSLQVAIDQADLIQKQLESSFFFRGSQRDRMTVSAKPWLFSDAKRPRMSFVISQK